MRKGYREVSIDAVLKVLPLAAEKRISLSNGRNAARPLKVYTKMIALGLLEEFIDRRRNGIPTIYYRLTSKGQQVLSAFQI